jgi:hypothetical protein
MHTQTFSSNGTWYCPLQVTKVLVTSTASGATFNGVGTIRSTLARVYTVVPKSSYSVVVSSGTVTVTWLGIR